MPRGRQTKTHRRSKSDTSTPAQTASAPSLVYPSAPSVAHTAPGSTSCSGGEVVGGVLVGGDVVGGDVVGGVVVGGDVVGGDVVGGEVVGGELVGGEVVGGEERARRFRGACRRALAAEPVGGSAVAPTSVAGLPVATGRVVGRPVGTSLVVVRRGVVAGVPGSVVNCAPGSVIGRKDDRGD
jgi:hypothetical protein